MSAAPSPFRFITQRRQQPPQQHQQQQSSAPNSRLRFTTPAKGKGRVTIDDVEGNVQSNAQNDIGDGHIPGTVAGRRTLPGPKGFLASANGPGLQRVDTVESVEMDDDDDHDNADDDITRNEGYGLREIYRKGVLGEWDAVEDPESPVRKRRKVDEVKRIDSIEDESQDGDGGVVHDAIEDAEEDGEEGDTEIEEDEGAESGIDEVVVVDFIRRRKTEMGAGMEEVMTRAASKRDNGDSDGDLRSSPTPAEKGLSRIPDHPPVLQNLYTPARPSAPAYRFPSPVPPSLISTPNQAVSAPSSVYRKPPRFRISTPAPASTSAFPSTPSAAPSPPTQPLTTKPTKPASAYFRNILPPSHQRNSYNRDSHQADLPLGLSVPSDWSPSKKQRRRGAVGGGSKLRDGVSEGKHIEGGIAEQVLGWTLETLSAGGSGELFGYGSGEERWRKIKVLGVSGSEGSGEDGMGLIENLSLGGVVVRGEETYGATTEMRRYLLVTGRLAGGSTRDIEKLGNDGVVRYKNPWWDMSLGGVGGDYRVLCAWDVERGLEGGGLRER